MSQQDIFTLFGGPTPVSSRIHSRAPLGWKPPQSTFAGRPRLR